MIQVKFHFLVYLPQHYMNKTDKNTWSKQFWQFVFPYSPFVRCSNGNEWVYNAKTKDGNLQMGISIMLFATKNFVTWMNSKGTHIKILEFKKVSFEYPTREQRTAKEYNSLHTDIRLNSTCAFQTGNSCFSWGTAAYSRRNANLDHKTS